MLFFKTFFITVLLSFVSAQYMMLPEPKSSFNLSKTIENLFPTRETKQPPTSELLAEYVKNRENYGLKDYKDIVTGLELPEIQEQLKNAGKYIVLKFDVLTEEYKNFFEKAERIKKTVYSYRLGSRSNKDLEYAARCLVIYIIGSALFYMVKFTLGLIWSPMYHIF